MSIAMFFLIVLLALIAVASVASAIISARALVLQREVKVEVHESHIAMNSRMDALLQVTGAYQRSLGVEEGKRIQKTLNEKAK